MEIQNVLVASLDGSIGRPPFATNYGLRTFRQLAGLLAPRWCHDRLRHQLGLQPTKYSEESHVFETARVSKRVELLETAALWASAWPQSFLDGAAAIKITEQTFARSHPAPEFAAILKNLPPGRSRIRHPWKSQIEDAELRRLRRRDPEAARRLREQRLIAAALERMKR